ncbi:hypothetical protein MASR2M66_33270 [Chloroflexota bacterium]
MKRVLLFISALTVFSLVLNACTMGNAASTDEPTTAATDVATVAPGDTPTEVATDAPASVDLAGPPMEVGSKYLYIDGTVLVAVPGGEFIMGYNFADNPERKVTVGDFWIYSTEVTNTQYALCVQAGKCTPPDPENSSGYGDAQFTNFPVTGVTHTQATDYCAFVKGRLPTEAEWEKAARGTEGNIFPWGDNAPACGLTNYANCKGKTTLINDYPDGKSFYELWDMSGNVREWVADWYEPLYNVENPVADPLGPALGEKRSVRGAGFADSANSTIAAHRFSLNPDENLPDLGFRCVVEGDPSEKFAPWCEMVGYAGMGPDGSPANCMPEVKCNDVSVTVSPNCNPQTNTPYTVVTFQLSGTPPDAWTYAAPGCNPVPGEQTATKDKYLCTPPGPVGPATASGSCTDVLSCASTCPLHYNKSGDACVWDGSGTAGTECLPGSTYDPLTQCCSALSGEGTDFNLCPAGFYFLSGVCVPNPKGVADNISVDITLIPSCQAPTDKPDDDDPGSTPVACVLPTYCPYPTYPDPVSCSCK